MMKKYISFVIVIVFISLQLSSEHLFAGQIDTDSLILNNINEIEDGYLEKTDGDPYIIFPKIDEQICSPKGVQFSITFQPALVNPVLLELFWSTDFLGFGEENKVLFTLYPLKPGKTNRFMVPLDNIARFTQVRLDFPSDISETFRVEEYKIVSLDNPHDGIEYVDTFRVLTVDESLNLDILVPYFFKALRHGLFRLIHDVPFLMLWFLLIASLLFFIRVFSRKTTK